MVAGKPGYVWTGIEWAPIGIPVEGADLGVTDHPALTGRSSPDSHPIAGITALQPTLDGKSNVGHTHAEQTLSAGAGIQLNIGVDNTEIVNIDLGSTSLNDHVAEPDPHAGIYADEIHIHNYSPTDHTHAYALDPHDHATLYDPLGQSAADMALHVAEPDPHTVYLLPTEVLAGVGIAVLDNGDGTIRVSNTAQNIGVAGFGYGQNTARNIPTSTNQGMQLDKPILTTIDATSGTTVATAGFTLGTQAPEGWYQCGAAVSFSPDASGRRTIRVTVNGDPANCPLIPNGSQPMALSGSNSFVQTSGPVYLKPGDRISVEAWQNSGNTLTSQVDNTVMSIIYTGAAA